MRFVFVAGLLAASAWAQPAPHGGPITGQMTAPKNLKVLSPGGLMGVMRTYNTALGVKCEYCHVPGDYASDDNPQKLATRKMIVLTRDVNTQLVADKVTCYTCHRGARQPATAPHAPKDVTPTGKE